MSTVFHDDTYNYIIKEGNLYVGNGTHVYQNGAYDKNLVNAILPAYFNGTKIYGTFYRCLAGLPNLIAIFIPKTYRVIEADLFQDSYNVETIEFEANSELQFINGWTAISSKITSFTFPPSLKRFAINSSFGHCAKLKTVFYQGMASPLYDSTTFLGVSKDLKIFVRKDYPYDTFGGRSVTKILEPPTRFTYPVKKESCFVNPFISFVLFTSSLIQPI
jgi:hypothetical protein